MGHSVLLGTKDVTVDEMYSLRKAGSQVKISPNGIRAIKECRQYLDKVLSKSDAPIYGINTGFGSLCDTVIDKSDLNQLQRNLVVSHACGMGPEVPNFIVRIMLALKIQNMAQGHSGVKLETAERLQLFFNSDAIPVVFEQGSLGASGDLAPLAHLSLPLIGEGEMWFKGRKVSAGEVHKELNIEPLTLGAKEGLALINGTQFMQAYLVHALGEAKKLMQSTVYTTALSFEAFDAGLSPLFDGIHAIRNHEGQQKIAQELRHILKDSEIANQEKAYVQDPYSFRCVPQVLGATWDSLVHIESVVQREINAVTDNPLIFPEQDRIVSGGNFHGQPMALVAEQMAIAIAEMTSISERRIYKMLSGQRGLPAFLVANPGLNSGFMIPQYTAASIVSQNKQLCTPAAVDTIDSSNGQEDHVSMGANAVTKLHRVMENAWSVAGIEWLTAAQGVEFRRPLASAPLLREQLDEFRKEIPFLAEDAYLSPYMKGAVNFLRK